MGKYKVVFSYSVEVEAEDERGAEDMAWELFGKGLDPTNTDDFACIVDEVEDVWDTNENGNHTCVDCMDEVSPDDVLGHSKWGEPRCEGCYENWKRS
jgi:hypothetical protein